MKTSTEKPLKALKLLSWRRVILALAALYIGSLGLLYAFQDALVFPGRAVQGRAESVVIPPPGAELVRLKTAEGVSIAGLYGAAIATRRNPLTVLYFYGNGEYMNASMGTFNRLRDAGANVMMADYAGYGMSGGSPSETGFYQTADAACDYLLRVKRVPSNRLIIMGRSIGGAVAIDLASRRPAQGLMTFSAFTSLPEVARAAFPILPAASLLRYRFDNEAKISRIACPVLIAHGEKDRLVPFSMSERLAEAAKSRVTRLILPKSGHDDVLDAEKEAVSAGIRDFLHARE